MKITPFVTKTVTPFTFKARKAAEKYPEMDNHNKNNTYYQVNGNKFEASKDTFTHQNTAKNTTPQNEYTNLLYSRIFLY